MQSNFKTYLTGYSKLYRVLYRKNPTHIKSLIEIEDKIKEYLDPEEQNIILKRFGIGYKTGHTLEEIAQNHNCSKCKISNYEHRAINRLKRSIKIDSIKYCDSE